MVLLVDKEVRRAGDRQVPVLPTGTEEKRRRWATISLNKLQFMALTITTNGLQVLLSKSRNQLIHVIFVPMILLAFSLWLSYPLPIVAPEFVAELLPGVPPEGIFP